MEEIDKLLYEHGTKKDELIAILQDIQSKKNYLPEDALRYIAEKLEIPVSEAYSVSTFFRAFSLEPRGRHKIHVCLGTTCHVKGGEKILEKLERDLGIRTGGTTKDLMFTLDIVNCLGCCSLAPAMMVDGEVYGRLTPGEVTKKLEKYK